MVVFQLAFKSFLWVCIWLSPRYVCLICVSARGIGKADTGRCSGNVILEDPEPNDNAYHWTCTRYHLSSLPIYEEDQKERGNFIRFSEQQTAYNSSYTWHTILLRMVSTEYCAPKLEQCRCKSLLESLIALRSANRIALTFLARPYIAGCKCYLGAAAKKGFKFLRMFGLLGSENNRHCVGKRDLTRKNYENVCKILKKHSCLGKWEITMEDIPWR